MINFLKELKKQPQNKINRWSGAYKTLVSPDSYEGVPRKEIWKLNKTTLWHYRPENKKYSVPIFLVYSVINQPFILDLAPGSSLIQAFMDNGYEVYLLDFGCPGFEDKDLSLNDYITKYIQKGVQRALTHSKANEITIMGFCLGGTLAAIYTSIAEEPIKNLILSLTPINFQYFPQFDQWVDTFVKNEVDVAPILDAVGLIPSSFVQGGIRLITTPVYYSPYLSLINRAYDEQYNIKWSRLNLWTKSHIPISGAALNQLANDLVKENKLINGGLDVNGKHAHLKNIYANMLVIGSSYDQLVPKEQITPIMDLVSSDDRTFHLLTGGHANIPNNGQLPSYLTEWLNARSNPI